MFLFQIKVFARTIKETTLARYFIRVTTRPSFKRLRVIKRINRVHEIWKYVSPTYLNLLEGTNDSYRDYKIAKTMEKNFRFR